MALSVHTCCHYYRFGHSKRAIIAGSFRTVGDASSPPGLELVAVVAVGTGGDVPHHRRLVTRTGGDEVADHHRRLVTRAGGDDGYHRQFVLPTGGDEVVQDKTPTPSSLPFFPFFPSPRPKSRPIQLVPIQSAACPNPRHHP